MDAQEGGKVIGRIIHQIRVIFNQLRKQEVNNPSIQSKGNPQLPTPSIEKVLNQIC